MIELFFKKVIEELGATGLLVLGLYWVLGRPLEKMSRHIHNINDELNKIYELILKETGQKNG